MRAQFAATSRQFPVITHGWLVACLISWFGLVGLVCWFGLVCWVGLFVCWLVWFVGLVSLVWLVCFVGLLVGWLVG